MLGKIPVNYPATWASSQNLEGRYLPRRRFVGTGIWLPTPNSVRRFRDEENYVKAVKALLPPSLVEIHTSTDILNHYSASVGMN